MGPPVRPEGDGGCGWRLEIGGWPEEAGIPRVDSGGAGASSARGAAGRSGGPHMSYVYLLIAIVAEVIATSALKSAEGFTKLGPSVIVVIGYAIAFFCLSLTLRTLPVGIAYAIWSGVGIVLVTGFAWIYYGQKLDLAALIGLGLIIAGVVVINLLSKSVAH